MKARLTGNLCFDGHKPSEEEALITEQCRMVCSKISLILDVCKASIVPELLDYYDILYRIGNKTLPDSTYIKRHKQRVLRAWKSRDKEIAESSVFGMIVPEASFRQMNADRDFLATFNSIKAKWIATLKKSGRFPEATTYENYLRLAQLMRQNLDKEFGNKVEVAKRKWNESNKIDDLSSISSLILKSYRRFVSSLYPTILDYNTQTTLDNRILNELSTRTDLHPYDREAFRMALEFNTQMM